MFYMCYKWGIAQQHVVTLRHCAAMLSDTDCGSCDRAHDVKRWKNRKRRIITDRCEEGLNFQVSRKPGCGLGDPIDRVMLIINNLNEWQSNSNLRMSAGNNVLVGKHPRSLTLIFVMLLTGYWFTNWENDEVIRHRPAEECWDEGLDLKVVR